MKSYRASNGKEVGHVIASRIPQSRETLRFDFRQNTVGLLCLVVAFLFCSPAAAQTGGLPTSIGWSSLPANTSLEASGACPSNGFGGDPFLFAYYCGNVIR